MNPDSQLGRSVVMEDRVIMTRTCPVMVELNPLTRLTHKTKPNPKKKKKRELRNHRKFNHTAAAHNSHSLDWLHAGPHGDSLLLSSYNRESRSHCAAPPHVHYLTTASYCKLA